MMREDWVNTELGICCNIKMGQSPPSTTYNTDEKGLPFFQGKAEFTKIHPIVRKWCSTPKQIADDNDILLSVRAPVGATNIANQKCAIGRGLAAIKYHHCHKYIFYYLNLIEKRLDGLGTGTTFKAISGGILRSQIIPLAPLPEQRAIVAKIEQLLSDLDNGIANLKTAKSKLEIYRQALLKKAFEGELTKEWRKNQSYLPSADELLDHIKKERISYYENQISEWKEAYSRWDINGNGKKPTKPSKSKIFKDVSPEDVEPYGSIPNNWKWIRLGAITNKIGDVDHKMPKSKDKGIPYLSTGNIKEDGTLDFINAKTISEDDYLKLSLKIKPEKGDVIFPRYGTIGRNVLVKTDERFLVSYSCAIIKTIKAISDEKFILYYTLSPVIKKEIKRYTVQTTQANIGISSIELFVFPLCSKEEQHQIVKEIETRLSVCDKLSESIDLSLEKSEALRQSILKKAFEGKLLRESELEACRQENDWEPAEKLLERIKKEKVKTSNITV